MLESLITSKTRIKLLLKFFLNPETEAYLVQALHEAAKDKLVLIIAHRLSTIANADKIVFLKDGAIMEQGSHAALMSKPDGHYAAFVALQSAAA